MRHSPVLRRDTELNHTKAFRRRRRGAQWVITPRIVACLAVAASTAYNYKYIDDSAARYCRYHDISRYQKYRDIFVDTATCGKTRDRFQRECLGTAFPKLFSQWERRSQEFNSSLIIRYTFCEHAATYANNSQFAILYIIGLNCLVL